MSLKSDKFRAALSGAWVERHAILARIEGLQDQYLDALFQEGVLGGHGECMGKLGCPTCVRKWEELKATAAHRL